METFSLTSPPRIPLEQREVSRSKGAASHQRNMGNTRPLGDLWQTSRPGFVQSGHR